MIVSSDRRSLAALIISAAMISLLMVFPSLCSSGAASGIECCLDMLIPSLFPFMVLSSFLMRSGASELAGRLFGAPVCIAAYLPRSCAAALLLSFIGGFPVGAKCITILYSRGCISRTEAQRMSYYCVCSGPAFLITAVGSMMLGNPTAGAILYASQLISGMLLCTVTGAAERIKKAPVTDAAKRERSEGTLSDSFIEAVSDGTSAAVSMCALVLVFSVFTSLLSGTGAAGVVSSLLHSAGVPKCLSDCLLPFALEVSTGCRAVKESCAPLWVYSAAAGFGGLCVHFQIFAILSGIGISKLRFLLFRAINAVLSALITAALCSLFPDSVPAAALPGGYVFEPSAVSLTGSAALAAACLLFALSIRGNLLRRRAGGVSVRCAHSVPQ